jgi:Tol biopolymer transport system component
VRALLGVSVLAASLAIPAVAAAPAGRIVFVRELGEQSELFSIRADRSAIERLTREPGQDYAPAWSPNGRLLASFGAGGIVIRAADGSVVRRIAIPVEGFNEELRWSPDGRRLSYLVEHCSYEDPRGYVVPPCADLWVVGADGQGARRLLDREVDLLDGGQSYSWSPASRRLVYAALTSGPSWLAVVDLRSGRHERLPGAAGARDPSWSPRGEIAFALRRGLFAVRADGRGRRRLVRGSSLSRPRWAPDGRRFAYLSPERGRPGNRWGVWVARADGRGVRIGLATDDRSLVWSPGSSHLLWENFGHRLFVAHASRPGSARFLTVGSDPDWR